jgi:hypothetical protein
MAASASIFSEAKCRRFLGIPKRRLVRPTINEISPDDTEITMPRLRTNLRIRMAQPYFFLL